MKYYKVIKENFLWEVGAIISNERTPEQEGDYSAIDPIFLKIEDQNDWVAHDLVEKSPDYFQRVYKVNLATKVCYELKDEAIKLLKKGFKE